MTQKYTQTNVGTHPVLRQSLNFVYVYVFFLSLETLFGTL